MIYEAGLPVDLRSKALYGLIGIFILTVGILFILSFTVILADYQNLESDYVRGEMNLIGNNVEGEIQNLQSNVPDWGAWDDTYAFARGEKPDYPAINLVNATFQTLRTNFIIITNSQGRIIYGQGYDLVGDTPVPLRPDLTAELGRDRASFLLTGQGGGTSGFLSLPEGPVLIASYPILRSDYSGPVQGSVIMGRFVNDPEIRLLTAGTNLSLSIRPAGSTEFSGSAIPAGSGSVLVRPLDEQQVEGRTLIRDIYGNDSLLLSLRASRDIYQQGKNTIFFFMGLQMAIVFVAGILILVYLDRMVLARMSSISSDFTGITRTWDLSARIKTSGNDEITRLADAANRMLDRIEEKHTALRESEERYAAIVNNAPEPVLTIKDGTVLFVNDAGVRLSGYSRGEIIGKSVSDFLTKGSQKAVLDARQTRTARDNVSSYETEFIRKDGRIIHLITRAIDIRYHGDEVTLALLVDITERKNSEEALRQANRKLNLLSGITRHDIKNQILVLKGFLAVSKLSLGDSARMSEFIHREERAADAIEQQIVFTKEYESLGVNAAIWQGVDAGVRKAQASLPMRDIRVIMDCPDVEVFADPLFEKVFYNLIDNALRYGGPAMTMIRISAAESDNGLVISVEDDGSGIAAEDRERLFERGFGHNTGLGLFLSREILSITGITITETGSPGNGARFEITVPEGKYRFTADKSPA